VYLFPVLSNASAAGNDDETPSTTSPAASSSGKEMLLLMEALMGMVSQCSNGYGATTSASLVHQDSLHFLARVVVELCKLAPTTFPAALAVGVGLVVGELSTVSPAVRSRLAQWYVI
jgi:phage head maturation protease